MYGARILVALALIGLVTPSIAGVSPRKPSALKLLEKQGARVVNQFQAGGGLNGWTLSKGGTETIIYTTADGKRLFVGVLLDETGAAVTEAHLRRYTKNQSPSN